MTKPYKLQRAHNAGQIGAALVISSAWGTLHNEHCTIYTTLKMLHTRPWLHHTNYREHTLHNTCYMLYTTKFKAQHHIGHRGAALGQLCMVPDMIFVQSFTQATFQQVWKFTRRLREPRHFLPLKTTFLAFESQKCDIHSLSSWNMYFLHLTIKSVCPQQPLCCSWLLSCQFCATFTESYIQFHGDNPINNCVLLRDTRSF